MKRLALMGFLLLGAAACESTEFVVENNLPGATLEHVRWQTSDDTYELEENEIVPPGAESEPVPLPAQEEDLSGVLHFELVANGRRVALSADTPFTARAHETTTFSIGPETAVHNRLEEP